jgi:hypothetical protein
MLLALKLRLAGFCLLRLIKTLYLACPYLSTLGERRPGQMESVCELFEVEQCVDDDAFQQTYEYSGKECACQCVAAEGSLGRPGTRMFASSLFIQCSCKKNNCLNAPQFVSSTMSQHHLCANPLHFRSLDLRGLVGCIDLSAFYVERAQLAVKPPWCWHV